jgi:antagonist of KipI
MTLLIEQPALIMSIQDAGRSGFLRFGLPESGPVDWWAFRAANRLVNNPPNSAELEIGFSDTVLRIEKDIIMVVCGAGYRIFLNDKNLPLWMAFLARKGDRLYLEKCTGGSWVYLAVTGGIHSRIWMGSRSVYPKAGLGRFIKQGDRLSAPESLPGSRRLAGRSYPKSDQPLYAENIIVRVIPGPQYERFSPESKRAFWSQAFSITSRSDRMGYRLAGTKLTQQSSTEMISQGMVLGEIQVPPNGQPIVMMPDHPTTGGYPSIGVICRVDIPLIAQAQPGESSVQFERITLNDAQNILVNTINRIDSLENPEEELWMNL